MSYYREALGGLAEELLEGRGYAVHVGEDDKRPELGQHAWWFTWASPDGKGDIETGANSYANQGAAWEDALRHFFEHATGPVFIEHVPD